ncbi:MAG: hypothetical protein RIQ68_505 [Pseudomonadota bacterium]|jgi:hypothetical protein
MADYTSPFSSLFSSAANANGIDPNTLNTFAWIESGGRPDAQTGSYRGLFQLSPAEFNKYGGGNIFDPTDNTNAAARKLAAETQSFQSTYGRAPTPADLYMVHQQGEGGYAAHAANPDAPAWQNMYSTAEGRQKGPEWAKQAIWGNLPDDVKAQFPGGVDSLTSRQFMDLWANKVARLGGNGSQAMMPVAGGFGAPANFDPNDPTSAMFAPPPQGAQPIGAAPIAPIGAAPINLPQQPNMRYSKLADALLGSAAGAQPTGWGSLLNALGDAGLGYSMANKADTQQQDYRSALAKALQGATGQDQLVNTMLASQDPALQQAAITAKMTPKVQIDRFKVDPITGEIFDSATGQKLSTGAPASGTPSQGGLVNSPLSPIAQKAREGEFGKKIAEAQASKPQANLATSTAASNLDRLAQAAKDAYDAPGLGSNFGGYYARDVPNWPGGNAADAWAKFQTLKSQISTSVLQSMRDASKTGGAVGSVSDKEQELFQNNLAALDRAQSLSEIKTALSEIYKYAGAAKGRLSQAYKDTYGEDFQGQPEGSGLDTSAAGGGDGYKVVKVH